jgi:hypothetical protein
MGRHGFLFQADRLLARRRAAVAGVVVGFRHQGQETMKGIALVLALGAMSAALAPFVAKADPQVLTAAQMDAVTAAGVVHLNLPSLSVIVLHIPDVHVNLDDFVVESGATAQVAVATTVGIAVCGVCLSGSPQVVATASALNGYLAWPGLR